MSSFNIIPPFIRKKKNKSQNSNHLLVSFNGVALYKRIGRKAFPLFNSSKA
jgi:hypothetical protein